MTLKTGTHPQRAPHTTEAKAVTQREKLNLLGPTLPEIMALQDPEARRAALLEKLQEIYSAGHTPDNYGRPANLNAANKAIEIGARLLDVGVPLPHAPKGANGVSASAFGIFSGPPKDTQ